MQAVDGYNPLRWDCNDKNKGCFNVKQRPKLEIFAKDLPRRIAFTDVDQTVEINSRFLFLEWKSHRSIPRGQELYAKRITALSDKITFIFVRGDAETMEVSETMTAFQGEFGEWEACDIDRLHWRIRRWADRADRLTV